ncbi:hypothetical protein Lmor_1949 [Legionella moravica]|uniref:Uncharacterized protein n=1 Tax=Legionella moravica TaxID=39962 RepID=A0A378JUY4_9GAMM|nr:hypothetical protein [Legionella moravica]KTD33967.1 hypothetical protein Lmor_1949 [Legionella moravica]STX61208.1 Uncharacterised protein [Legionella moravica]
MEEKCDKTNTEEYLNVSNAPELTWLLFNDLYINPLFFKRGLLLVSPTPNNDELVSDEQERFVIKEREFIFHLPKTPSSQKPESRSFKKTYALMSSLITFAATRETVINPLAEKPVVLFNKRRRDEIFLPLLFGDTTDHALYLYPWIAKAKTPFSNFSGFSQFVTAGCMFGASLQAITHDGETLELINHQIRLRPGQVITSLHYDESTGNPYEHVLFSEFEKNCLIIKACAKDNEAKRLFYHLPSHDYMLFGIELFVRHQMTYDALDTFIKAVLAKKEFYKASLGALCHQHGIEVTFQSPFDNLFGELDSVTPTESLLEQLKINPYSLQRGEEQEENMVLYFLSQLSTNEINLEQRAVWQDFLNLEEKDQIPNTIEGLFKIANAVMVAMAARGKADYETCSLLPLSEKQIQLHYAAYVDKWSKHLPSEKNLYPQTVNLTTFDPVITYSPTTTGLLFYFASNLKTLSTLLIDKKIIQHASRNIGLFANKNRTDGAEPDDALRPDSIEFQEVVPETKKL